MELDSFAKLHAFEFLGECEDISKIALEEINDFVKNDDDLNDLGISEQTIIYFLRSSKFRVEQTKKRIKSFYLHRIEIKEWFSYRDPFLTELKELLEIGVFLPVLKKDEKRRQIVIIRTAAHIPSKHKQNDVIKIGMMILDYLFWHDPTLSVYGIRAIFDMKGIAFGHAMQMTPTIIRRAVNAMECYPARVQKLEFVNSNRGINIILDVFRSFMSPKLKERIVVSNTVPDYKASDCLPQELGGSENSYRDLAKHWKRVLEKNYQWFNNNSEKYGCS